MDVAVDNRGLVDVYSLLLALSLERFVVIEAMGVLEPDGEIKFDTE